MSAPAEPRHPSAWLFLTLMVVVAIVVFAIVALKIGVITGIFVAAAVFACGAFPFVLWR